MSQLFKYNIDGNYFSQFIIKYSTKIKNNEYNFSLVSYKKAIYDNKITELIEKLKSCYHKSKLFYIKRAMNYKNFLTILRQLCTSLSIKYSSKILYNKSKYNINYNIYLNNIDSKQNTNVSQANVVVGISNNIIFN
jgi:hypothetical protein